MRAAFPLLALTCVVLAASPASADSINLLRAGTSAFSPSILFDGTTTIFGSTDEATSTIERDCVAIDDDVRDAWSRSALGGDWRFGRFAWEWAPTSDPGIVYVICVERRGTASVDGAIGGGGGGGFGAAMQMAAALAWGTGPQIGDPQISGPQISNPQILSVAGFDPQIQDPQIWGPQILDPQTLLSANPQIFDPQIFNSQRSDTASAGSSFSFSQLSEPPMSFDSSAATPISVDPVDAPPVPEPGTWLLLGSGLAAAWRARRR